MIGIHAPAAEDDSRYQHAKFEVNSIILIDYLFLAAKAWIKHTDVILLMR
jgi:hypothetical protein